MDTRTALTRTKAGRRLMGFLRTLNMGDAEAINSLVESAITDDALQAHGPEIWTAQLQYVHAITGGLRIVQVLADEEYRVVVLAQARQDSRMHLLDVAVAEEYPHKVAQFVQRIAQQ